mmetsp:Transcript_24405/g.69377  ORF Transcript_24405/g.69377 Transcript_24405/m.69377 type:complete len:230 (+) Transcript_24405:194-883(+)
MAQIRDPMSVLSNRHLQLPAHMLQQGGEEVYVLREDARILHAEDSGALQLAILNVQVELTAALGLTLIVPVHHLAAFGGERDRDDSSLRPRLGAQTIDDVVDLLLHAVAVISLVTSTRWEHPLVEFLLGVLPTHVFLRVELQSAQRKQFRLDRGALYRDVLDDAHKVAHGEVASLLGNVADVRVEVASCSEPGKCRIEVPTSSAQNPCTVEHVCKQCSSNPLHQRTTSA